MDSALGLALGTEQGSCGAVLKGVRDLSSEELAEEQPQGSQSLSPSVCCAIQGWGQAGLWTERVRWCSKCREEAQRGLFQNHVQKVTLPVGDVQSWEGLHGRNEASHPWRHAKRGLVISCYIFPEGTTSLEGKQGSPASKIPSK